MDTSLREIGRPTLRGTRAPSHESYHQVRHNVVELLSAAREVENPVVPACPEWTLRDLLAHLAGSAALAIGRMSGWPAAHPSASADMGVAELLEAWDRLGSEVDLLLSERTGRAGNLLVTDAFTHELDIRYAVGAPLPGDHPAFPARSRCWPPGSRPGSAARAARGADVHRGPQWTVGEGEAAATVTADRYDLYRSLAGRRTHAQITSLGWGRDSHRWLPAFTWGPFSPPSLPSSRPLPDRLIWLQFAIRLRLVLRFRRRLGQHLGREPVHRRAHRLGGSRRVVALADHQGDQFNSKQRSTSHGSMR